MALLVCVAGVGGFGLVNLSLSPPDRQDRVSMRGVRRGGGEREEGAGGQQEVGRGA
jgi:hypothetical protein